MTVVDQINNIISQLESAREDAIKVDAGKAGAPGTRVRAAALDVRNACDNLRKSVIDIRKTE